ncbi:hypothetical protein AB0D33_38240 [Streptomyces sp. NPDC048404]|uniref:hypothetical protein n=1 Tax=unclassified Streptomyces TaxID=2593676 RepID=UPI003422CF06
MTFPDTPLGVRVELYVSGAWLDITGDVYTNNLITITRGKGDEAARTDAGTCTLLLKNETGRYSSRNPRSDLYGLIGRNTLIRVSVQPGATRLIRFVGEVSSWPPQWSTAKYVTVTATAAGILRRLGQGASPLASPMRREYASPTRTHILAYWPMEEGSSATSFASAIPGIPPMAVTTAGIKPAAYTAYTASDALPTLGDGALAVAVPAYTSTGQHALRLFAAFPDTAPSTEQTIATITTTTGFRWVLSWWTDGNLTWRGFNPAGTQIEWTAWGGTVTGTQSHIGLDLVQTGSTFDRRGYRIDVAETTLASGSPTHATTQTFTGTLGRIATITLGGSSIGDVAIGHVALADATTAYASTGNAMIGYAGESARSRIIRLCGEEGIPVTAAGVTGFPATQVGPQSVAALLDLLQEAIDADGGRLYEQRDGLALAARTRATLYTQTPALTLDYAASQVAAPLDPVDDDAHVHNDVTIARQGGSSARAIAETGPLSVQAPPNGVGRYTTSTTLNLWTDEQCKPMAYWYLHVGTRDAPRYPSVSVEVHKAPALAEQVAAIDMGARAVIANPPPWLPPEQVELLVEGYTETLGVYTWDITFNASPGAPYLVGMTDDDQYGTADTDGSTLAAAATTTATALMVNAPAGARWAAGVADLPYVVNVEGEDIRVNSVTAAAEDAFGRTVGAGWGSADSGQSWQVVSGAAANFAVNGSRGVHSMAVRNTYHTTVLPVALADAEVMATVVVPAMATGDGFYTYVALRADAIGTQFYFARLYFATAGTVELTIRKRVPAETVLATYATKPTYTAGSAWQVRFRVEGSTLSARFWAAGDTEPSAWQVTATDTALTAPGGLALRSYISATNTNTLPVAIAWDDARITTAQRFNVARAVNGVAKSHPAGAPIALTHQAIAAL